MSAKLTAALDAARRGFSVFPVVENTKQARIKNWPNLATTDPVQITEWWTQYPNDNIGGATQDSVVVDVDPRNGGKDTLKLITMTEDIDRTLVSNTAGGGNHIFYAAPEPVKGGTNKLGPGVDIKARGGYVLLPGSTIDGRAYTWQNDRPIAPAMPWLLDRCTRARPKADAAGERLVEEDAEAVERATKWMLERAPTAEWGEIDDTTYKVAARLYDFGVSVETAIQIMLEWNDTKCNPPGDLERLLQVTESASVNRENAIGKDHSAASGFDVHEIGPAPDQADKQAIAPASGMKLEGYFEAADKALTSAAIPLIKGVLDKAAMSIVYGESNTGKTFMAVDMAFHLASGSAWAGRKVAGGAVVYVAADGGTGVYKRLAALRQKYPNVEDVPLYILKFPVDLLHSKAHATELVTLCRDAAARSGLPLELVVIDTLSRALAGGDENSSTDMGAIVKNFDAIREATGVHLMVVHHSGKDRAKGARGHSLLRAATDTEIEIERGRLTVTKQRDMEGDFVQNFRLETVVLGLDADGETVTSCVVELLTASAAGTLKGRLTKAQNTVYEAVKAWLGEDTQKVFGWQDVARALSDANSDAGRRPSTLKGHLSDISDAHWFRYVAENKYVLA